MVSRPATPPEGTHLPRSRVAGGILSTPDGGVCLLASLPGFGRRTALAETLGQRACTVELPPRPVEHDEWRTRLKQALGDQAQADPRTALASSPWEWLVVLDLDPELHRAALDDLVALGLDVPASHRLAVTGPPRLASAFRRLQPSGRLVELDGDDLALTPDEGRRLLAGAAPTMPEEVAQVLVNLCDGWLAALSAGAQHHAKVRTDDTLTWMRTRGAEQQLGAWLDTLDPATVDMLLDTAILEELHPDLVDSVTAPGNGNRLPALGSPRGPIRVSSSRHEVAGPWFDRHPLLTSLLLFQAAGRPREHERHRRAADWYRTHGLMQSELVHRLSAGDPATASDRFQRHENELFQSGLAHMALRWYATLPDTVDGEQLLREGWAFAVSGRIAEARAALDRLRLSVGMERQAPPGLWLQLVNLDAEADVLDAWLAERDGDLVRTAAAAGHARSAFGESWTSNSHQIAPLLQARAALHLGDVETCEGILASVRTAPFLAATLGEGRRTAVEAELAWVRGEVYRARTWAGRYQRWLADQDPARVSARTGGSIAGFLAFAEAGAIREAVSCLQAAVEHATSVTANLTDQVLASNALASVLALTRQLRPALAVLGAARAHVLEQSPSGGLLPLITTTEALLRLSAGDTVRAERLTRQLPASTTRQQLHVRLALHRGLPAAAALARELAPSSPREEATASVFAGWAAISSSRQRAEEHFMRAADIAAENGMTTLLVDAPDNVLSLARKAAAYYVHDPLITLVTTAERLRRASSPVDSGLEHETDRTTAVDVPLTRGELQLLALLPTRASNTRIADELGVSINTVKTRLRRLYTKLDVHDRDQAIARAAALGLIGGRSRPAP